MRAAILELRETCLAAAPGAVDTISYALPALRYRGRPLVCYGAWTKHLAFYPMSGELVERHREQLRGYGTDSGTIRFTPQKPLPRDLVTRIVRERVEQLDARLGPAPGAGD